MSSRRRKRESRAARSGLAELAAKVGRALSALSATEAQLVADRHFAELDRLQRSRAPFLEELEVLAQQLTRLAAGAPAMREFTVAPTPAGAAPPPPSPNGHQDVASAQPGADVGTSKARTLRVVDCLALLAKWEEENCHDVTTGN